MIKHLNPDIYIWDGWCAGWWNGWFIGLWDGFSGVSGCQRNCLICEIAETHGRTKCQDTGQKICQDISAKLQNRCPINFRKYIYIHMLYYNDITVYYIQNDRCQKICQDIYTVITCIIIFCQNFSEELWEQMSENLSKYVLQNMAALFCKNWSGQGSL